jgi:hypothetical protein
MERHVRYQVLSKRGSEDAGEGKTVNVSSRGVLFTCQHDLQPGRRVRLCISWPVPLNDKCALKLVIRGRVVRSEEGRAAVEINSMSSERNRRAQCKHPVHEVPGAFFFSPPLV